MRVLPAYQDARDAGRVKKSCADCQRTTEATTRQMMGCAYLPTAKLSAPWTPKHMIASGETLTVCPGYSTTLPMVAEVVAAYPQWENGTLDAYLGDTPTRALLDGLAALRAGIRERDKAEADERAKNGGG